MTKFIKKGYKINLYEIDAKDAVVGRLATHENNKRKTKQLHTSMTMVIMLW